ncbi:MAG: aspartate-alanine antiporter [Saccharospirillaceae bacterium]|nr:aspartate-alanine antiporter [Saccharospirillaceae bacterium]MCD8532864.1 aspartate-alanine antiporter [Saccharospirillaceae bacterium]
MDFLKSILAQSPEIAIFLSLAGGYWLGKIQFGKFQLGGVAGSLLVAVLISQIGIHVDNGVKALLFALFIYAVGFESGPQFFRSLGKQTLKEIMLAAVLAVSALITVIVIAKIFLFDKGLAAGIAAGGLTQSAIIGTASAAIEKLGLSASDVQHLQSNVAVGYAVTYIFGSFGAILICVNLLPWIMRRGIRDDALAAEAAMLKGKRVYSSGESPALPDLIGRIFLIKEAAGKTIDQLESMGRFTVARVKRNNQILGISANLVFQPGDIVLLVGRRIDVVQHEHQIGNELASEPGMEILVQTRNIELTAPGIINKTIAEILDNQKDIKHGVYVLSLSRQGIEIDHNPDTRILRGDIITVYGLKEDIERVSSVAGTTLIPSDKTDFVYHGFGLACGLMIGLAVIKIGSIPLTLGAGGGALLSGLLFGWYRGRHSMIGNMPIGASTLLRDLGLAGFVVVVGLQSGQQAVTTVSEQGLSIFFAGVLVTLIPMIITLLFGRYVLKYDNASVFAGALAGSRSANPAFGEVLDKSGNSTPTTSFAITYALANVFLTLLGPLIVAFV